MTTLAKRLEDPNYKAWVKCGLCLSYVKKGLEEFADLRSKRAHSIVVTNVQLTNSCNTVCPQAVNVKQKRNGDWTLNCCNKCDEYVSEITKLKDPNLGFSKENWKNSNVQLWPTEAWEMMKVFMNQGQKASQKNAEDFDLSAILNFLDHCCIPRVDLDNPTNIKKVRDARNTTMHSASMKMSIADFVFYTDSMIDLLGDPLYLSDDKEAKDSVQKIKEIRRADFCITTHSEFAVLSEKTEQVQRETKVLYEVVYRLEKEYKEFKHLFDDEENTLRNLLQQETDQREQHLSQLETQIQEKQGQIKELSSELTYVKNIINQDQQLYRKMETHVKNTVNVLDKTSAKLKEVSHCQIMLRRDVEHIKRVLDLRQSADSKEKKHLQVRTMTQNNDELSQQVKEPSIQLSADPESNELSTLRHRSKLLQSENDALKQMIDRLNISYEQKKNDNEQLTVKNKMLEQANNDLLKELKASVSEQNTTDIRRELEKYKENNEELEREVEILKGDIEHQKHEMTEAELLDFRKRNEFLEMTNTCLENKIEQLTAENERIVTKNSNLESCISSANRNIIDSDNALKETKTELMLEQQLHKAIASELQNLKQRFILESTKSDLKQSISEPNLTLEQETDLLMNKHGEGNGILNETLASKEEFDIQARQLDSENKSTTSPGSSIADEENFESETTMFSETNEESELTVAKTDHHNGIFDMKVASGSTVGIMLRDDQMKPWITGCVFLSNGQCVLCDNGNSKIKLLSSDLAVIDSLYISKGRPADISVVGNTTVIVTLPAEHMLQFIELTAKLELGREIKLEKYCPGISVVENDIYVTRCKFSKEIGEVEIVSKDGTVKRRLGAASAFKKPYYLYVSACTGWTYVSDYNPHTITCLSVDGSVLHQYSNPELRRPTGLYVDADENVIVCGYDSHNLQIMNRENYRTFLTEKDGIKQPQSICYRPTDGTLVVGCNEDDALHVFKLLHG